MVMPHSALGAGQHAKWRTGRWGAHRVDFSVKRPWDLERLKPNDFFPVPACVAFARRSPKDRAIALVKDVELWEGRPGTSEVTRTVVPLHKRPAKGSPYRPRASQGATLVPRRLFLVEQTENPALVHAGGRIMVNPRRGKQDKTPWRDLDLAAITSRMIESTHVLDTWLGESVAPYVALAPVQAVLPISTDVHVRRLPASGGPMAVGGLDPGPLRPLMRERWGTISGLWEANKRAATQLTLLEQLDYRRKLSKQIDWQAYAPDGALRLLYGSSGRPTAALLSDRNAVVDYTLFWMPLESDQEGAYLMAVINSDVLRDAVEPFMPKGQWGARHVQKHLWNLPIPRFDLHDALHVEVADAGYAAAAGAARQLEDQDELKSAAARRIVRDWLAHSDEGREVERVVSELLEVG